MKRMKTERAGDQTIRSTFGDNVFGFLGDFRAYKND